MTLAIERLAALTPIRQVAAIESIEQIFFMASGTQAFADTTGRLAFRERWLGRYLTHDTDYVWLAVDDGGAVGGYLVGCLDDPARTARFADIGYFHDFANLTRKFPAHLHVNLDASVRGQGVGGQLVQAFCGQVRGAGLPGVHVVTGKGVRNASFYKRLGFDQRGSLVSNGREIVLLGRTV